MTDLLLSDIFKDISYVTLIGLIFGAIFFVTLGLREIRELAFNGLLYIIVGLFFLCAHFYYLTNIPEGSKGAFDTSNLTVWRWLSQLLAPAIIAQFIVEAAVSIARSRIKLASIEVFFGLTLFCFLYMLGQTWPADLLAMITALYLFAYIKVELTSEVI